MIATLLSPNLHYARVDRVRSSVGKLFISHSSKDDAIVRSLQQALGDHGVNVWIDSRKVRGGDPASAEIQRAIEEAEAYAVVVSPAGLQSSWVATELRHALEVQKQRGLDSYPVVSLLLDGTEPGVLETLLGDEPLYVPLSSAAGGATVALDTILVALGKRESADLPPAPQTAAEPVGELVLELTEHIADGVPLIPLRSVAVLLQLVGGAAMLATCLDQLGLGMVPSVVLAGSGAALLSIGASLHLHVKKRLATQRSIRRNDEQGSKPVLGQGSVLYLRPFDIDGQANYTLADLHRTAEEDLIEALKKVGPAIALGRPGEEMAHPGATRVYHDDQEWQSAIDTYLAQCVLCVLVYRNTSALRWELSRCICRLPPEKLLVFISRFDKEESYALLCQQLAGLIPHAMPAPPQRTTLVRFDRDWRPHLLSAADVPLWMIEKQQGLQPLRAGVALYEVMLAPVFGALGIPYKAHKRGPSRGFIMSIILIVGFLFVIALVTRCGS